MSLPSVTKVHWLGDRRWRPVPPKIDNKIKLSFSAGSKSATLRQSRAELLRTSYSNFALRYSEGSLITRFSVGIGMAGDILDVSMSMFIVFCFSFLF